MRLKSLQLLLLLGASTLATQAFALNDGPRGSRQPDAPPPPRERESDRARENERGPRPPAPPEMRRDQDHGRDFRRAPRSGGPPPQRDGREQGRHALPPRDRDFGPPPGDFRPPFASPPVCPHCGHTIPPHRPRFRGDAPRAFPPQNPGPAFRPEDFGPRSAPDRNPPPPPRGGFHSQRRGPAPAFRSPQPEFDRRADPKAPLRKDRPDDRRDFQSHRHSPPLSRDNHEFQSRPEKEHRRDSKDSRDHRSPDHRDRDKDSGPEPSRRR